MKLAFGKTNFFLLCVVILSLVDHQLLIKALNQGRLAWQLLYTLVDDPAALDVARQSTVLRPRRRFADRGGLFLDGLFKLLQIDLQSFVRCSRTLDYRAILNAHDRLPEGRPGRRLSLDDRLALHQPRPLVFLGRLLSNAFL